MAFAPMRPVQVRLTEMAATQAWPVAVQMEETSLVSLYSAPSQPLPETARSLSEWARALRVWRLRLACKLLHLPQMAWPLGMVQPRLGEVLVQSLSAPQLQLGDQIVSRLVTVLSLMEEALPIHLQSAT